ncbi:Histidine kinase-, DNA gyrase B-, and HSP90-like ATPase [compost metagenome]
MKPERSGTITISGRLEAGLIVLCIQDDGMGMTNDEMTSMLQPQVKDDGHGFGVYNINERLKLYYGLQYGLTYRSAMGVGTTVEIRIPPIDG